MENNEYSREIREYLMLIFTVLGFFTGFVALIITLIKVIAT